MPSRSMLLGAGLPWGSEEHLNCLMLLTQLVFGWHHSAENMHNDKVKLLPVGVSAQDSKALKSSRGGGGGGGGRMGDNKASLWKYMTPNTRYYAGSCGTTKSKTVWILPGQQQQASDCFPSYCKASINAATWGIYFLRKMHFVLSGCSRIQLPAPPCRIEGSNVFIAIIKWLWANSSYKAVHKSEDPFPQFFYNMMSDKGHQDLVFVLQYKITIHKHLCEGSLKPHVFY